MIKRLQALGCLELLVGVDNGLKNECQERVSRQSRLLNCSAGMLAGSTPMTEIFYEYLSFTRLSKLLPYPESTVIPLDECRVFYRLFYSSIFL